MQDYEAFLQSKRAVAQPTGIDVPLESIHEKLFPFQRVLVQWALRKGRAAIFADCGLGKTLMQLEWARLTGQRTLILAPLAVASQTIAEGKKIGVQVHYTRSGADLIDGINISNYEMLDHFNPDDFGAVVLDESSILKSYMGKTKRALVEAFSNTPYRLACTATPAPNDVMEIGNHSEFLGIMPSTEMLMRWFINDTMSNGHYRLKGHATRDFWEWVASWAISLRKPSDIGFSDDGFVLPELQIRHCYADTDITVGVEDGQLFRAPVMSATTLHREMRLTAADRAQAVADLVNDSSDTWAIWCNTNYEADELFRRIPGAIEVRGSDSIAEKERWLAAFTRGEVRVIISKALIAGFGLNWQHCHKTAFVGLSYSFEQFYQAVRRFYRFGQSAPVEVVIIAAETESTLVTTLERKVAAHMQMSDAMNLATSKLALEEDRHLLKYDPQVQMILPDWLERGVA